MRLTLKIIAISALVISITGLFGVDDFNENTLGGFVIVVGWAIVSLLYISEQDKK